MNRNRSSLLCALAAIVISAPGTCQPAGPEPDDVRVPLKIVSAEVQRLPAERSLVVSGKATKVRDALVLKTAVSRRSLDRFAPARQPMLFLGRHVYPIHRQEPDNWDLKTEKPLDPSRPVGEVEFLYFLIPNWTELPEGAAPILAVHGGARRSPDAAGPAALPPDPLLARLAGSDVFRRAMIVDRR